MYLRRCIRFVLGEYILNYLYFSQNIVLNKKKQVAGGVRKKS